MRLHRGGRLRGWLGRRLGGGPELGERAWRRVLHGTGSLVLLYFLVPANFFVVVPKYVVLLAALVAVLAVEGARWRALVELPTIRPHEAGRVASFAYFAVGLTAAVLLFPEAVAVAVVLGTALVDPLIGELRSSGRAARLYPSVPLVSYAALAAASFLVVGGWGWISSAVLAAFAAALAVGVERLRYAHLDDDLTMTIVPGVALAVLLAFGGYGVTGIGG